MKGGGTKRSKLAIVQMKSSEDKWENLRRALRFIEDARGQGARLVAFPEFSMAYSPGSQSAKQLTEIAEESGGDFVSSLRRAARDNKVYVLATMYERSRVKNRVYDTAILMGPGGELRGRYRKLHLYDAFGFKESDKFVAGAEVLPPISTELGKVGIMICYDLRFPEQARLLALDGAQVILAPSGWVMGPMKEEHWFTMVKARALENGVFVVAPAQVGNIFTGRSALVDPFGLIKNDLGQGEKLLTVDLDLGLVDEARQALPLMRNRRDDVYRLSRRAAARRGAAAD